MQKLPFLIQSWKNEILNHISNSNSYFNLKEGIKENEISEFSTLEDDIKIPKELIELYKNINVEYNSISSSFSFTPENGGWYQLIPFNNIQQEWEGIQDLYFEESLEEGSLDNFDPKVQANDYANPRWIPFADGGNGDYLLFDTNPSELGTYGQIILLENESWERIVIADSLESLIESQIEKVKKKEPTDFWDFILENESSNNAEFPPQSELKNLLKTVPFSEVKHLIPEDSWIYQELSKTQEQEAMVHFYDGDLKIDYIDLTNPFIEYENRNEDYETYLREQTSRLIFISGDVHANNLFSSNDDGAVSLMVLGSVYVNNMIVGGSEIHILQDLNVKDLLWGNYNHGELNVALEIFARVIIFSEQFGFDEESSSYQSEYYFNEESDDYEDDAEANLEAAEQLFESEHLFYSMENINDNDLEEISFWGDIINRDSVIESLKQNEPILKREFGEISSNEEKTPLDKIKAALKELVPICVKISDKKNSLYERINSLEMEEDILDDPQEVLDAISDHLDEQSPHLYLTIDHKSSIDDVAYNIRETLQKNFGFQDVVLPQDSDYNGKPYVLSEVWIDFELALRKIDKDLQLTFIDTDTDSYWLVLHKEIDKWAVQRIIETLGFESHLRDRDELDEKEIAAVPIIFEHKKITEVKDLKIQKINYLKLFEVYQERYFYDQHVVLEKSKAQVFVYEEHQRKSDEKKVEQNIYFLLDDGSEIIVWISPNNLVKKLFSGGDSFEILYQNSNENIFQHRSIFDFPNVVTQFSFIWEEFLIHIERCVYYYNQLKQTALPKKIKEIIDLQVVQDKYNDFDDSDKSVWLGNYSFAFDWSEESYVCVRISETIDSPAEDDVCHYYFDAFTDNDFRYRYCSSQYRQIDDRYKENTAIAFLDYHLFKKAITIFEEGSKKIIQHNETYLRNLEDGFKEKEREADNLQKRKANYQVQKPYDSIVIEGVTFTLKDRLEAEELLKSCVDFNGDEVYDPFYMYNTDGSEEDSNSFFLIAENEVEAEKLYLDTYPPEQEDCYILGYIFLKKVTFTKYVEAWDLDFSPPIICLEEAFITSLMLAGNTHYFQKDLHCINLHGEYNHGSLIVKGHTQAEFIYADDFEMNFNTIAMVASYSSNDQDIKILHNLEGLGIAPPLQLKPLLGTHNLENCVFDSLIYKSERGVYKLKDEGYRSGQNHYKEGEKTFFERLKDGESLVDFDKIERLREEFINDSYHTFYTLFTERSPLKDLPLGELHYEYLREDYTHMMYYFQKTEEYYIVGYWNTWHHTSVSLCYHTSGDKEKHVIVVFYWNEKNEKIQFQYSNPLEEYNYYNNIGQKIGFESIAIFNLK